MPVKSCYQYDTGRQLLVTAAAINNIKINICGCKYEIIDLLKSYETTHPLKTQSDGGQSK